MTRASFELTSSITRFPKEHRRRRSGAVSLASLAVVAVLLASCGGDDDDAGSTTTSTSVAVAVASTTTAAPPRTTVAATTVPTTVPLVTAGATLIVANASGINGAAGRMTDALAIAGFQTGPATNSSEGQLETTKVYYDPTNTAAEAVANSIRLALGGGAIQVLELATPAPVETGEVGDASIVVAMGNDVADKTLAELQGLVVAAPETTSTTSTTAAPDG